MTALLRQFAFRQPAGRDDETRHDRRAERLARENERLQRRLAELRALTVSAEGKRDAHS